MLYSMRYQNGLDNMFYPQYFDTNERALAESERKTLVAQCKELLKQHPDIKGVAPNVWAHWFAIANAPEYLDRISITY